MEKFILISFKLNFTRNTLGSCGLIVFKSQTGLHLLLKKNGLVKLPGMNLGGSGS